jgi:hypothetical protein
MNDCILNCFKLLVYSQAGLKFQEETEKCFIWSTGFSGLETWTICKADESNYKVWKCDTGEGWRSVGQGI